MSYVPEGIFTGLLSDRCTKEVDKNIIYPFFFFSHLKFVFMFSVGGLVLSNVFCLTLFPYSAEEM